MSDAKTWAQDFLKRADIEIDGKRPWDLQVHDERFYARVMRHGSLGLGESYMDGWWDASALDQFFYKLLAAHLDDQVHMTLPMLQTLAKSFFVNQQSERRAFEIGERHYDVGNDIYEAMLDTRLTYTCGYWKNASDLDAAQVAKLDLICRKIGLTKEQHVLDIGCGWGSFAQFAAEKYGSHVTGITVSKEQIALGMQRVKNLPVTLEFKDYRDVSEQYDHLVSVGMFEHVGPKNYRTFFGVSHKALKDGGLFLLHTIGGLKSSQSTDPWIEKYIFPNSVLPSLAQITHAVEGLFVIEDIHNFGADYDKTLMAWWANFESAWPTLKSKYGDRFYRMWKYYLLSSAGNFRSRRIQLWQIVLSKRGVPGGYQSIR